MILPDWMDDETQAAMRRIAGQMHRDPRFSLFVLQDEDAPEPVRDMAALFVRLDAAMVEYATACN